MKLPLTIQEAIALGLDKYDPGKICRNGHTSPRYVCTASCMACTMIQTKRSLEKRRKADPDTLRAKGREYQQRKAAIKRESKQPEVEAERSCILGLMFSMGLNLPTGRAEAKELGTSQYFNGKPCPFDHIAPRQTCSGTCAECLAPRRRAHMAKQRAEKPEEVREKKKEEYRRNIDKYAEKSKAKYAKNRESELAKHKEYYLSNSKAIREKSNQYRVENVEKKRDYDKQYSIENRHAVRAVASKRRSAKLNATPAWLTDQQYLEIKQTFKEARLFEEQTGVRYDVDHIVPLRGKIVCGLHVPWNLRAITREENGKRTRIFEEFHLGFAPTLGGGARLEQFQL